MHSLKLIPVLALTAALGVTGLATAQSTGTPRLTDEAPFLGRISDGAGVNYKFDRAPGKQTVTIGRHKATVRTVGLSSDHEYTATVSTAGFKAGRSYRVTIVALSRSGKTKLTYNKVLFLHRSMNRPVSG